MVRVGLAVGGAVLVLLGGAALTWASVPGAAESTVTPVDGISGVELNGGSGDVEIRYVPGARGEVREEVRRSWWGGGGSGPAHRVEGGELRLDAECGWNCEVRYWVTLPAPVPVSGELGSGDLDVDGMTSVDARVGSGGVELRRVAGPVVVKASSGEVTLKDIGGDVDVESSSGGIDADDLRGARFRADVSSGSVSARLAAPQDVDIHTGSGGIDLSVPSGGYRVESDTGSGGEEIGVAQDPNAPRQLRLSTGSGSIEVKPL
ncbi:DUF4097 family beta strand repeat-containing protein [Saccharopolyspora taberi]|uniref:DUF4097 domain-containing protein n=1 Tax=Saccharopolyspora taberi TaxID=60895 RepID=A0ABN3VL74_9PSEU